MQWCCSLSVMRAIFLLSLCVLLLSQLFSHLSMWLNKIIVTDYLSSFLSVNKHTSGFVKQSTCLWQMPTCYHEVNYILIYHNELCGQLTTLSPKVFVKHSNTWQIVTCCLD